MSNIQILADELTNDPEGRGYSDMDDAAAAVDLNTVYRTINKTSMTASEILNAVDETEYLALTDAKKDRMWQLLAIGDLNPFGVEEQLMIGIFGSGSTTITALAADRKTAVSRAQELGLRKLRVTDVKDSR